jgi:hypothetical protein
MRAELEKLHGVNPDCTCIPPGYDQAMRAALHADVVRFTHDLTTSFGFTFTFSGECPIQDSTVGAVIGIPSSLVIGEGPVIPCIRISNHQRLFVITVCRRISEETEKKIEDIAEPIGFLYTPESMFGEPFDTRERINGDLFNQLYDWV